MVVVANNIVETWAKELQDCALVVPVGPLVSKRVEGFHDPNTGVLLMQGLEA